MILPNSSAIDLYQKFRTKVAATRVLWRGKFYISKNHGVEIDVALYKRTTESKLPSLKPYSKNTAFSKDSNQGGIHKDIITYV